MAGDLGAERRADKGGAPGEGDGSVERWPGAVVVGAGPAGLMAAEALCAAGRPVLICDAMPSPARKFLMAGRSGLNLTKNEPEEMFRAAYGAALPPALDRALAEFGPEAAMAWARGLGQDLFTGSTGRVFPLAWKASPLLRAWLARLTAAGAVLRMRWRWTGWAGAALRFATPQGIRQVQAQATVLALGGASWSRLGSDGTWSARFPPGLTAPFAPSNAGLSVSWSPPMERVFGQAVKAAAWIAGDVVSRGEVVVGARGLEGGGLYALSRPLREGAPLRLDLFPDLTTEALRARLGPPGARDSLANRLRKRLGLKGVRAALLHEWGRPLPGDLAPLLKALPVRHRGFRPLDEAISTAGGLRFAALTDGLMLHNRAGTFAAGEMLAWDAPTGGYLLTACLATGRLAGIGAAAWIAAAESPRDGARDEENGFSSGSASA